MESGTNWHMSVRRKLNKLHACYAHVQFLKFVYCPFLLGSSWGISHGTCLGESLGLFRFEYETTQQSRAT